MRAQLILIAAGVSGGLGLGWLTAPAPETRTTTRDMPAIAHAGVETRASVARFERLGLAPAPELDAGPPPPDIAVLFRRDLTAIEDRAGSRIVWVIDFTQTHQRRALRLGDVYHDGWRISRIGVQSIELRRRREVRTVEAFALPVIDP